MNRGKSFLRGKQANKALKMLNECLKREQIPIAQRLAGEIYLRRKEYSNAIKYLRKAQSKTADNPKLLSDLCIAYYYNNQITEAKKLYQLIIEKYSENKVLEALKKLKITRTEKGNPKRANWGFINSSE